MNRNIFKFFNGTEEQSSDPIQIARTIKSELKDDNIETLIKRAQNIEENEELALNAIDKLVSTAYKAFDVKPLSKDGTGLTFEEMMELIKKFGEFNETKKKSIETSVSLKPQDSPSPPRPQISRVRNSMAGGSIGNVPKPSKV